MQGPFPCAEALKGILPASALSPRPPLTAALPEDTECGVRFCAEVPVHPADERGTHQCRPAREVGGWALVAAAGSVHSAPAVAPAALPPGCSCPARPLREPSLSSLPTGPGREPFSPWGIPPCEAAPFPGVALGSGARGGHQEALLSPHVHIPGSLSRLRPGSRLPARIGLRCSDRLSLPLAAGVRGTGWGTPWVPGLPPGERPGPGGEAQATLCVSHPACPGWASDGAQELLLALDEPSRAIPSWALPHSLPLQPLPQQP